MLQELSQAEEEKEKSLKGILQRLIQQFSENHCKWRQLVSVTAGSSLLSNCKFQVLKIHPININQK